MGNKRTLMFARIEDDHEPLAFQLFGHRPERIAEAAKIAEGMGADIIDINAGCPIAKVVRSGSGSALLKDLDKLITMAEMVVATVDIPVSMKVRLGISTDKSLKILAALENTGIAFLTVHGRTASQNYGGKADWTALRGIVEASTIPIIVNGDARDEASACELLEFTGAEGVMLGRAIRGRPDIVGTAFDLLKNGKFERMSRDVLKNTIEKHAGLEVRMRGEDAGMRFFRKHIVWYLKAAGLRYSNEEVGHISTLAELVSLLEKYD